MLKTLILHMHIFGSVYIRTSSLLTKSLKIFFFKVFYQNAFFYIHRSDAYPSARRVESTVQTNPCCTMSACMTMNKDSMSLTTSLETDTTPLPSQHHQGPPSLTGESCVSMDAMAGPIGILTMLLYCFFTLLHLVKVTALQQYSTPHI